MVIGLTGPTGAGKSEASNYLKSKGFVIIDADRLVHDMYINCDICIKAIGLNFPSVIKDGIVDRKKLAGIVFSDKKQLQKLNKVVNPYIIDQLRQKIKKFKFENIILDAPTLFESGADSLCDKTIAFICNEKIRLNRIISRDGLSKADSIFRISSQPKDDFYIKHASITIRNDSSIDKLKSELDSAINAWINLN